MGLLRCDEIEQFSQAAFALEHIKLSASIGTVAIDLVHVVAKALQHNDGIGSVITARDWLDEGQRQRARLLCALLGQYIVGIGAAGEAVLLAAGAYLHRRL